MGAISLKRLVYLVLSIAKVSPDAFEQLCIQVTFYRLHGHCAPVYETSSTRGFLHGRTETCRSCTSDAKKFVLAFQNPTISASEKYSLLQKAAASHSEYIRAASQGLGVDRHLLGLRCVLEPDESHAIFNHPLFAKSSRWQLSTSALLSGERIDGTGFGAAYSDGYGMNYMIAPNLIKIGVESKISCDETSSGKFIETLNGVYTDMKLLCEAQIGSKL